MTSQKIEVPTLKEADIYSQNAIKKAERVKDSFYNGFNVRMVKQLSKNHKNYR